MKLIVLVLLLTTTFQYANSSQIVEKPKIKKELDRFKPNWDSLDARVLPQWYKRMKVIKGRLN